MGRAELDETPQLLTKKKGIKEEQEDPNIIAVREKYISVVTATQQQPSTVPSASSLPPPNLRQLLQQQPETSGLFTASPMAFPIARVQQQKAVNNNKTTKGAPPISPTNIPIVMSALIPAFSKYLQQQGLVLQFAAAPAAAPPQATPATQAAAAAAPNQRCKEELIALDHSYGQLASSAQPSHSVAADQPQPQEEAGAQSAAIAQAEQVGSSTTHPLLSSSDPQLAALMATFNEEQRRLFFKFMTGRARNESTAASRITLVVKPKRQQQLGASGLRPRLAAKCIERQVIVESADSPQNAPSLLPPTTRKEDDTQNSLAPLSPTPSGEKEADPSLLPASSAPLPPATSKEKEMSTHQQPKKRGRPPKRRVDDVEFEQQQHRETSPKHPEDAGSTTVAKPKNTSAPLYPTTSKEKETDAQQQPRKRGRPPKRRADDVEQQHHRETSPKPTKETDNESAPVAKPKLQQQPTDICAGFRLPGKRTKRKVERFGYEEDGPQHLSTSRPTLQQREDAGKPSNIKPSRLPEKRISKNLIRNDFWKVNGPIGEAESADAKYLRGVSETAACPQCGQSVKDLTGLRREHYYQFHYDVYFSSIRQSGKFEKWIGGKLGSRKYKNSKMRICLHCKERGFFKGRLNLLRHIIQVHPKEFEEMKKEYKFVRGKKYKPCNVNQTTRNLLVHGSTSKFFWPPIEVQQHHLLTKNSHSDLQSVQIYHPVLETQHSMKPIRSLIKNLPQNVTIYHPVLVSQGFEMIHIPSPSH